MISLFSDGKWLKWLSKIYIFPLENNSSNFLHITLLNFDNNGEF